jgi:hypothetical protein
MAGGQMDRWLAPLCDAGPEPDPATAGSAGGPYPGLAEQFADARDDLAAVQLNVSHQLVVGQARHAVL